MGFIFKGFFSGGAFLEGVWGISQRVFQGFFSRGMESFLVPFIAMLFSKVVQY